MHLGLQQTVLLYIYDERNYSSTISSDFLFVTRRQFVSARQLSPLRLRSLPLPIASAVTVLAPACCFATVAAELYLVDSLVVSISLH